MSFHVKCQVIRAWKWASWVKHLNVGCSRVFWEIFVIFKPYLIKFRLRFQICFEVFVSVNFSRKLNLSVQNIDLKTREHPTWTVSPPCAAVSSQLVAPGKSQLHPSQPHLYGFSPVWVRWWAFRWDDFVYAFVHPEIQFEQFKEYWIIIWYFGF